MLEWNLATTNKSLLAALRATARSNSQDPNEDEDKEQEAATFKFSNWVPFVSLISSKRWVSKATRRTRSVQSFLKIPPLTNIPTTSCTSCRSSFVRCTLSPAISSSIFQSWKTHKHTLFWLRMCVFVTLNSVLLYESLPVWPLARAYTSQKRLPPIKLIVL